MEIANLNKKNCIRIKGKAAALVVDPPEDGVKTTADAVLTSEGNTQVRISGIENARLAISGPGEYEIGGIKISTLSIMDQLAHRIGVDAVDICLIPSKLLEKFHEKVSECDIVAVRVDSEIKESAIAAFSPKVAILYGEGLTSERILDLGKDDLTTSSKFQTTADKLPGELQIIQLQ